MERRIIRAATTAENGLHAPPASVSRGSRPISSGAKKSATAEAAGLAGPYASPQPWIPESVEISTSIVERRENSHCEKLKFRSRAASSVYARISVIFMMQGTIIGIVGTVIGAI